MNISTPFKTGAQTALLGALALGLFGILAASAQDAAPAPAPVLDTGNTRARRLADTTLAKVHDLLGMSYANR